MKTSRETVAAAVTVLGLLLALLSGLSCGLPGPRPAQAEVARAEVPRAAPDAAEADVEAVIKGSTALACDIYTIVGAEGGNVAFSPYSISAALAMAYAGARNETAAQMGAVLRADVPQTRFPAAYNVVDQALRGNSAASDGTFTLHVANSLWSQIGRDLEPAYLETLARYYGAGVLLVDFRSKPEPARLAINDWVAEQTANKIEDLIPADAINNETRLMLVNAVYFNALWQHRFPADLTRDRDFHRLDGTSVEVHMMGWEHPEQIRYGVDDSYQAVALPYRESTAEMLLIVPDSERFRDVEDQLSAEWLAGLLEAMEPREVDLDMPRFTIESSMGLGDTLTELGMWDAFVPFVADFSGIDGTNELFIQGVRHRAFVAVGEKGTEAAAAASIEFGAGAMPPPDELIELTIDRPFLFLIRDSATGVVLFLGRVEDPTQS